MAEAIATRAAATVPETIRLLCRHRGLTGLQLAARVGMSPPALYARLNRHTAVSASDLAVFAWALGVRVDVFYKEEGELFGSLPTFEPPPDLQSTMGQKYTTPALTVVGYEGQLQFVLDPEQPALSVVAGQRPDDHLSWRDEMGTLAGGVPG